jgi:hypothetical protein
VPLQPKYRQDARGYWGFDFVASELGIEGSAKFIAHRTPAPGSYRSYNLTFAFVSYHAQMSFEFSWDERKAASNLAKHRVSFPDASTIFDDPLAITYPDGEHANGACYNCALSHIWHVGTRTSAAGISHRNE